MRYSVIKNFPIPRKADEVKRFIVFCSYYRKFIKIFAEITRPLNQAWAKKEGLRAIHILKQIQLCQDIENLHIGQVYSVEFGPAEKIYFRSLPGSVLDFKLKLEDLDRSKQIRPSNISIQGNFESQNSNPQRKNFSDHSLGQYRTSHITIFNYKPSTGPRSGPNFFSRRI